MNSQLLHASAINGTASGIDASKQDENMESLFEAIVTTILAQLITMKSRFNSKWRYLITMIMPEELGSAVYLEEQCKRDSK
ncbi:hypothetical protein ACEQPO_11850 [Bacillus sp. SL00103]